ncbi:MAG: hypothetical protein V1494_06550 [Candidatus Diapherotrites archaeon]
MDKKAKTQKIILMDSSAILNDFGFSFEKGTRYLITSKCFNELKDVRSKNLAENALHSGALEIIDPCPLSVQKALHKCREINCSVSEADESVFALALELKQRKENFSVLSDDFSLQNLLKKQKINFKGVMRGEIKKVKRFKKKTN